MNVRRGLLAVAVILAACRTGENESVRQYRVGERVVHDVRWDTVYSTVSAVQDTLLLLPRLIAAHDGLLYAYDYGDARLKAFDRNGELRWTQGRLGRGPGEFTNPTYIAFANNGDVWVTDAGAGRLTVVSREGAFLHHSPFQGRLTLRTIPIGDRQLTFPSIPEHLWQVLDTDGRVTDYGIPPISQLREAHPNARAPLVDASPDGSLWGIAFILASPFLIYEDARLRCIGNLIEGASDFPAVESYQPGLPVWAVDVAVSDSSMFVLARGQTEYEREILDEYSALDCSYIRTLRLPRKLQGMAYDGGTFYFYHEAPAPTILALKPAA